MKHMISDTQPDKTTKQANLADELPEIIVEVLTGHQHPEADDLGRNRVEMILRIQVQIPQEAAIEFIEEDVEKLVSIVKNETSWLVFKHSDESLIGAATVKLLSSLHRSFHELKTKIASLPDKNIKVISNLHLIRLFLKDQLQKNLGEEAYMQLLEESS
jgi:hypothetical protein